MDTHHGRGRTIVQITRPGTGWQAWLNLVWSMWIFLVPLNFTRGLFTQWLWPTLASYAVFLVLFVHIH